MMYGFSCDFLSVLTGIFVIENFGSLLEKLNITMVIWLTATADAAAGASHDLDCVKFGLAGSNFLKKFPCIAQLMGNTYIQVYAAQPEPWLHGCLPYHERLRN